MPLSSWGLFSRKALLSLDQSTARINIWEGAVRSGKTVASLIRWIEYCVDGPPGDLIMIGKTERTLKRNIIDPLVGILGTTRCRYIQGTGEVHIGPRRIYVAGANDERAQDRIRGLTLAGAYGDELTLWPESMFAMLLSRLSVPGACLFGTTNPDGPYHWLKVNYLDRAGELDLRSWHFTLEDNPNLDPKFVASLKREYRGLWYKRFIEGQWVLAEGAIYDMWDEATHVRPTPKDLTHWIVAGDYGTTNPCTFGLYGWSGSKDPVIHLASEYYYDSRTSGRQLTDAQYADAFAKWLGARRPERIYLDPSAASFIAELRKRGYGVTPADNEVLDGIRFVSTLLSAGRFLVDPSCKATIAEFGSYVWDQRAAAKGEDKPIKDHDHAMDRNRYALYSHFRNHGPAKSSVYY